MAVVAGRRNNGYANLNQSQGGMYIRWAMKIGLVAPVKPLILQVRMRGHRYFTYTICALHLGLGSRRVIGTV